VKTTSEFKTLLDAIKDILANKPVDNLHEIIRNCHFENIWETTKDVRDTKYIVIYSTYENRILQGESPEEIYGTSRYDFWQKKAHETLEDALNWYK